MATDNVSALRFSDFGELPTRMLAPLEGYEKMPLVSLEEAVKPLVKIVPKIERNVYIVKMNCQQPEDGLNTDESASIMLYTLESAPREDSLYVILNTTLRSEDRQKLVPWYLYLRLILTALTRLPSKHRFVVRGIKEDLHAQYPKNKSFIWWGFSSCTTSVEVLENELFLGKSGTRTLFQIECHTGKDIKNHSFIRKEEEVLLLPARQFSVKGCLNSGNNLHIIHIEEIDPLYPLLEPIELPKSTVEPRPSLSETAEAQFAVKKPPSIIAPKPNLNETAETKSTIKRPPPIVAPKPVLYASGSIKRTTSLPTPSSKFNNGTKTITQVMFEKYDVDQNGSISRNELRSLCYDLGYYLSDDELNWAWIVIDKDGSGLIDYREFAEWWRTSSRFDYLKTPDEEQERLLRRVVEICRSYDHNDTGCLGSDQFTGLCQVLRQEGILNKFQACEFSEIDRSGDGKINFNELIAWFKHVGIFDNVSSKSS